MTSSAKNRAAMPHVALIIDDFRNVFGADCQVLFAKEGDLELGARPSGTSYPFNPFRSIIPSDAFSTPSKIPHGIAAKKRKS